MFELTNSYKEKINLDQTFVNDNGGEGTVILINDTSKIYPIKTVAKVAKKSLSEEKIKKLALMISHQPRKVLEVCAWPIDTVHHAKTFKVMGYVMPFAKRHRTIHNVYDIRSRRQAFPLADWTFCVTVAANVVRAIQTIHDAGYVIGDINQKNIMVDDDSTVIIIDSDSFQVSDNGTVYFCDVGFDEFLAPELFGKNLSKSVRTPNHDNFSVAVMIFKLLFLGQHPFSTFPTDRKHGTELSVAEAIQEHAFGYHSAIRKKMSITSPDEHRSLQLSDLPNRIQKLFEDAFSKNGRGGSRPTCKDWIEGIDELLASITLCSNESSHHHVTGLACPWCRLEKTRKTPIFPERRKETASATEWDEMFRSATQVSSKPAPPKGNGKKNKQLTAVGGAATDEWRAAFDRAKQTKVIAAKPIKTLPQLPKQSSSPVVTNSNSEDTTGWRKDLVKFVESDRFLPTIIGGAAFVIFLLIVSI